MIDLILALLVAASALLGLLRGFVGIVVGTLSWLLAGWAAFRFGNDAAHWWAAPQAPGAGHLAGGYIGVFITVMVTVALVGKLLKAGVHMTLLGGVDRMLGGALGVLRGLLLACVLLFVGSLTPLPAEPAWQQSRLRPVLQPGVDWMRAQLPALGDPLQQMLPPSLDGLDGLVPAAGLPLPLPGLSPSVPDPVGKPGPTGDNGVLGEVVAERGWPRAVDPARGAAGEHATAPALPTNIEPAPARPDDPAAPARSGSPGQARPASL